jgi:hypothetical protein
MNGPVRFTYVHTSLLGQAKFTIRPSFPKFGSRIMMGPWWDGSSRRVLGGASS